MNDTTQDQGRGKGIMMATLIGAAVGAGVALLFAPSSGRETRGWLAQRSRQIKDGTTSAIAHGKDAVQRAANQLGES